MSIELRSLTGIRAVTQEIREGDFLDPEDNEIELQLRRKRFLDAATIKLYEDDLSDMMRAIGSLLPCVWSLTISATGSGLHCDTLLSVKALAAAFGDGSKVEYLTIGNVRLFGEAKDFELLSNAFQHLRLTSIRLNCSCQVNGTSEASSISPLDSVLQNLATMDCLEYIILEGGNQSGKLQASTISCLCRMPQIRQLSLITFPLSNEALEQMAIQLSKKKSSQLQRLALGACPLTSMGCSRLGEVILSLQHSPQLEAVHINIRSIREDADPSILYRDFANALRLSSFNELRLDIPNDHFAVAVKYLKSMLHTNYCLEEVNLYRFMGSPDDDDEGLILYRSAKYNRIENDEDMSYLLKINKLGRGKLLPCRNQPSGTIWYEILKETDGDLNRIFDLVSLNPVGVTQILGQSCSEDDGDDDDVKSDDESESEGTITYSNHDTAIKSVRDASRNHAAVMKAIREASTASRHSQTSQTKAFLSIDLVPLLLIAAAAAAGLALACLVVSMSNSMDAIEKKESEIHLDFDSAWGMIRFE